MAQDQARFARRRTAKLKLGDATVRAAHAPFKEAQPNLGFARWRRFGVIGNRQSPFRKIEPERAHA
jgi:hypothetical protein